MTQVKKFLSELDDYELAYFVKFKLQGYIPETQSELKKYILKRGLTTTRIEQLIKTNPKRESKSSKLRCPRCSSDKIRTEKNELTNSANQTRIDEKIICNVCELRISDSFSEKTKKPIWQRIADFLVHLFFDSR